MHHHVTDFRIAGDCTHQITFDDGADFDPETLRHWPRYVDELAARQWPVVSS
jgi:hypothetical protein